MAVDRTSFLLHRPEWSDAPSDVVDYHIAAAKRALSSTVLGDVYDDAVELAACRGLARSPYGASMRLANDSDVTVYDRELEALTEPYGRCALGWES